MSEVFDDWRTKVRATDPETSHEAAESSGRFAKGHRDMIAEVLAGCADADGLTCEMVSKCLPITYAAVSRRMCELERAGIVVKTVKFTNERGHTAMGYRLKPNGKA